MEGGAGQERGRRIASLAAAILGALLLLVGGIGFYASRAIFDSDGFASRASEALKDPRVSERLSEAIVEELLEGAEPDLINARPLLLSGTEFVVSSAPFRAVFREGVERAHRTLFTRERDALVLNLADATSLAIDAVSSIDPRLAAEIPKDLQPRLTEIVESDFAIDLVQAGEKVRFLSIVLPLLGLLMLAAAVPLDRDRRRGFLTVAVTVAVAMTAGVALVVIARGIVVGQVDTEMQDAASGVWDAYFGDLVTALLIATGGALLLAAAVTTHRRADPLAPLRRVGEAAAATPRTTLGHVARALLVLAVGVFFIFWPDLALDLVAVAVGAYAVFYGLSELMLLISPPPPEPGEEEPLIRRLPVGRIVAALGAVALVVVIVLVATGGDERRRIRAPGSIERCNGFTELCDRSIGEVVFPAVHNAMSAAEDGYLLPNNDGAIPDQLEAGARALLIDAHWGIPGGKFVVTDLEAEGGEGKARKEAVASTSEEFVATAERLVKRLGTGNESGEPEVYFCHVFCELGATPAVALLSGVKDFLDTHPDEVVILFIEDYVAPEAMAVEFEQAELLEDVYTHDRGEPLPTLRKMIASDRRLFVMAENTGGGTEFPWYHQGFELTQETPFTFHTPAELAARASCDPNRGTPAAPLFQFNHWVEAIPRSPKTADEVNSRSFMLERARLCTRIRNLLPNILAVDFWDRGNLFEVANLLNGLPADARPEYAESG